MLPALLLLLLFAISFLLGSIPWGLIISKAFFKKDIRDQGSGNIGATNAVRSMGIKGGAAVFLLDAVKGVAAGAIAWFGFSGLLAGYMPVETQAMLEALLGAPAAQGAVHSALLNHLCASVAFLGCVMGHIFCPWLGFHGGKGISVAFGCEFFALTPVAALIELVIFVVFTLATRIVSVGSLAAAIACPVLAVWLCRDCWLSVVLITAAACLVIWAHRGNIGRLIKGEENRFGKSHKGARQGSESQ